MISNTPSDTPNTGAAINDGQMTPADPPRRVPDGAVVDGVNSCGDRVLLALQHRMFVFISAVWLLAVVVDGALFFFLMVGWDAVPTEYKKNLMLNTRYCSNQRKRKYRFETPTQPTPASRY